MWEIWYTCDVRYRQGGRSLSLQSGTTTRVSTLGLPDVTHITKSVRPPASTIASPRYQNWMYWKHRNEAKRYSIYSKARISCFLRKVYTTGKLNKVTQGGGFIEQQTTFTSTQT